MASLMSTAQNLPRTTERLVREREDETRTISPPTQTAIARGKCSEFPLRSNGPRPHRDSAPKPRAQVRGTGFTYALDIEAMKIAGIKKLTYLRCGHECIP